MLSKHPKLKSINRLKYVDLLFQRPTNNRRANSTKFIKVYNIHRNIIIRVPRFRSKIAYSFNWIVKKRNEMFEWMAMWNFHRSEIWEKGASNGM